MEGYVIRIAGEGDAIYVNELKQLTERLGISKLVFFEGGVYGNRNGNYSVKRIFLYYLHIARILVLWWQRH